MSRRCTRYKHEKAVECPQRAGGRRRCRGYYHDKFQGIHCQAELSVDLSRRRCRGCHVRRKRLSSYV